MVSGSPYTSVLNTFLMMNLCEFAGSLINRQFVAHTSGDDVCVFIPSDVKDEKARWAFYKVFSWPDLHQPHGSGLYLKYCVISHDVRDIKPCSTECFVCSRCGVKVVRPLYKLFYNYFVSSKFYKLKDELDVKDYRKIIYEGDLAWANGLRIATILLSAIGKVSTATMSELADKILKVSKRPPKVLIKAGLSAKVTRSSLVDFVYDTYSGERISHNCPKCNEGYERMILYKYQINEAIAQRIANATFYHPYAAAYWLRSLTERYNLYDESGCQPPSMELKQQVLNGAKSKYDYDELLQYGSSCFVGRGSLSPIYPRRRSLFQGPEVSLLNLE